MGFLLLVSGMFLLIMSGVALGDDATAKYIALAVCGAIALAGAERISKKGGE